MTDAENKELFLNLSAIFSYLNATPNSRCVSEGEEVLNARHLVLCGITGGTESRGLLNVFALCLQTSALQSRPHEINGTLIVDQNKVTIEAFSCSCKAGLSGKCKHVSAVLLKCSRGNILELEKISGTDVSCYWSNQKKKKQDEYRPCPIMNTNCLVDKKNTHGRTLTNEESTECFNKLIAICTTSAQAKHLSGRRQISNETEITEVPGFLYKIMNNVNVSPFLPSALDMMNVMEGIGECCTKTYNSLFRDNDNIDIIQIAASMKQGTEEWKFERQFRITGSRCYSIFTYKGGNWEKKSESYFYPKFFTNRYVQHGIKYEKEALYCYKYNNNSYEVYTPGLIVCNLYPWMAYSADGVVFIEGKPSKLLEIKCPYIGKDEPSIQFIHSCNYLQLTSEGVKLKKHHAYYGQVQLGMALLNLPECDFILYSSKSKTFLNIIVQFDEEFAKNLMQTISLNYFKHMLHTVCEKKNKN